MPLADVTDVYAGGSANGFTVRWVSSSAAGGGDGTTSATSGSTGSWTLAEALTNAAAGQLVRIQDDGTYNRTAACTPTNDGDETSGWIVWCGYANQNGADSNSGRPIIDFGSNAVNGWDNGVAISHQFLENLEIANADGTYGIRLYHKSIAYNCYVRSCSTTYGMQGSSTYCYAVNCEIEDSGTYGIWLSRADSHVIGTRVTGAGSIGIWQNSGNVSIDCTSYNNGSSGGIYTTAGLVSAYCTVEDNADDGYLFNGDTLCIVWRSLITNHDNSPGDYGLNVSGDHQKNKMAFDCHTHSNDDDSESFIMMPGKTTGDPSYGDRVNGDLSISNSSNAAAQEVGHPNETVNAFTHKGAMQPNQPSGSGGGAHMI